MCIDRGDFMERRYSDSRFGRLENMEASETYLRRINAQEILIRQKRDEFVFPSADGTGKLSGRCYEFREPTLRRKNAARSENLRAEFHGEPEESQPTPLEDDAEERVVFWSIQGDFIYRHHIAPRVQFYVPKEKTFPIPPKYIDVTRSTHTDLDGKQEKPIDDHWNVDSSRHLSDSWKRFTKFILRKKTLSRDINVSLWRLTKVQTTTRPDHVWPEVLSQIGKSAQKKQEWAFEKTQSG